MIWKATILRYPMCVLSSPHCCIYCEGNAVFCNHYVNHRWIMASNKYYVVRKVQKPLCLARRFTNIIIKTNSIMPIIIIHLQYV